MGRGYSANRSTSARPTSKGKRTRSLSLGRLKTCLGEITDPTKSKEEVATAIARIDEDEDLYASEEEDETIVRPDVLTKYKMCGTVTDRAVDHVIAACVTGARTIDLCRLGDEFVEATLGKMFQKSKGADGKKMVKGVCFPTTVSVNNTLCHHAPFSESDSVTLRNGDVVKVSVSCHVDGYPTTTARTVVVGVAQGEITAVSESVANTVAAANTAMQGIIRLMEVGMDNHDVTDFIAHVGKTYGVEPLEGVLSNRTKRWILDGSDCIIARRVTTEDPQQEVGDCQIGPFQVWTLDVAFTNSKSFRLKPGEESANIFRRNEIAVIPRRTSTEELLSEIREKFLCFPWSPSRLENPLRARLGMVELRKTDMLDSFPALGSARGTITSRASCTVAVTDKRVNVICGLPQDLPATVAACVNATPSADLVDLISEPLPTRKSKKGATETPAANDDAADDDRELEQRSRKAHRSGR